MTEWTAHAQLERRRIGAFSEHVGVMVAFEDQGVTTRQPRFDMRGDVAGVGEQAEAAGAVGEYKLAGFARIMRHGVGVNGDVIHGEILVADNETDVWKRAHCNGAERRMRSDREPHRQSILARQRTDATNVIAMFMGNQNGGELGRITTEARQAALGFTQREAAIHQNEGVPAGNQQAVAAAAAAEYGKTKGPVAALMVCVDQRAAEHGLTQLLLQHSQQSLSGWGSVRFAFHVVHTDATASLVALEANLKTIAGLRLALRPCALVRIVP